MYKPIFLLLFCLSANIALQGQTTSNIAQPLSVGANAPDASAMLDVQATDKGMLVPRMTTVQRNAIASPAVGLLVFDTGENDFFFRTASAWVSLEVQTLNTLGNSLNLSNGGGSLLFGSGLSLAGSTLSATDPSATNEIQTLSLAGDDLSISGGNTVSLYGVNLLGDCGDPERTCFGNNSAGDLTFGIGTCPDNNARLFIKDTDSENRSGVKIEVSGGVNPNRKGMEVKVENGSNTNDGIVLFSSGNTNSTGIVDSVVSAGAGGTATGARFRVSNGANTTGINMRVENGSNTNDGIVLFSRGNNKSTGIVDSVLTSNTSSTVTGARLAAMNGKKNLGMNILADDGSANTVNGQNIGLRVDLKDNTSNDNNATLTARDIGLYVVAEDKTADYAAYFDGKVEVIGAATSATSDAPLRVAGGFDAEPGGGGHIQSGLSTENNIVMDGNEIMARNNGAVSTLFINNDGGDVRIGNAGTSVGIGINATANPLHMVSGAFCSAGGQWTDFSDRRLKTAIANLGYGLGEVMALRPVSYLTLSGGEAQIGFIAQEVREILPEVVSGTEGDPEKGETLGLAYGKLTAVLVKAVQEQQAVIEKQEERLTKMEREMAEMKAMLQEAMRR